MQINSIEFIIFFSLVFCIYWFICRTKKIQNIFLIFASLFFYGIVNWKFAALLMITAISTFLCAIPSKNKKLFLLVNIMLNLGILCVFKYLNFFVENFVYCANCIGLKMEYHVIHLLIPVGVSFYTFIALSYSFDVYRMKIAPSRDFTEFCAMLFFFPQLLSGPITKSRDLIPQFSKVRFFDYGLASDGLKQILVGAFSKMVIADNVGKIVDTVWNDYSIYNSASITLAIFLYSIQIYADFAGYSNMSIGVGKLLGIRLNINFSFPYFSRTIAEFWRKWHISLTSWFREYIYIPLGGSRCSKVKVIRNTFVIFLVCGFWHGAEWTYIIWGAYHAILFVPLLLLGLSKKCKDPIEDSQFFPTIGQLCLMMLTFIQVTIGWIIFRSPSISIALDMMKGVFNATGETSVSLSNDMIAILIITFISMYAEWLNRNKEHTLCKTSDHLIIRFALYSALIGLILYYSGEVETFIYFQY